MHYHHILYRLSLFADEGVVLPLTLAMATALWLFGWKKGAYGLLLSYGGTMVVLVAFKLFLYFLTGFRIWVPYINFVSPSSHAAAGALIYGILTALLLRGGRASVATTACTSVFFALLFGLTRVQLHVHTRSEVVVGCLLGIAGAIAFAKIAGQMPRQYRRVKLAAAAALVIMLMYGHVMPAEQIMRNVATAAQIVVKKAIAAVKE